MSGLVLDVYGSITIVKGNKKITTLINILRFKCENDFKVQYIQKVKVSQFLSLKRLLMV